MVEPYRMRNSNGVWYLAAVEVGMLKSFCLTEMRSAHVESERFTYDPEVKNTIERKDDI